MPLDVVDMCACVHKVIAFSFFLRNHLKPIIRGKQTNSKWTVTNLHKCIKSSINLRQMHTLYFIDWNAYRLHIFRAHMDHAAIETKWRPYTFQMSLLSSKHCERSYCNPLLSLHPERDSCWWGLYISDTTLECSFIISHVHSVIRPCGGLWLVDFQLPWVHCPLLPAVRSSAVPTHSRPTSYSCGRSVITAVWTLSAGSPCVREQRCNPNLLSSRPQQREEARWQVQTPTSLLLCSSLQQQEQMLKVIHIH